MLELGSLQRHHKKFCLESWKQKHNLLITQSLWQHSLGLEPTLVGNHFVPLFHLEAGEQLILPDLTPLFILSPCPAFKSFHHLPSPLLSVLNFTSAYFSLPFSVVASAFPILIQNPSTVNGFIECVCNRLALTEIRLSSGPAFPLQSFGRKRRVGFSSSPHWSSHIKSLFLCTSKPAL